VAEVLWLAPTIFSLYLVKMCHGNIGEKNDQLKRDSADPIVRAVMVKFMCFSSEDILYSISFVS